MNTELYLKAFVFEASSFKEFKNGACTRSGNCATSIVAKVINNKCMGMAMLNDVPAGINSHFGLPIFGAQHGDVLADRVQYGRIPDSFTWDDPKEPVVCEIFNNKTCIRFAMMSPLRIIEFYGQFTDIRSL